MLEFTNSQPVSVEDPVRTQQLRSLRILQEAGGELRTAANRPPAPHPLGESPRRAAGPKDPWTAYLKPDGAQSPSTARAGGGVRRGKENLAPQRAEDVDSAAARQPLSARGDGGSGAREARLERAVGELTMELRRAALSAKEQAPAPFTEQLIPLLLQPLSFPAPLPPPPPPRPLTFPALL